jgi:hypothetical protein
MTMKHTLEDCAIEMHSESLRRTRYDAEKDTFDTSVTVSQAYEIAESIVSREWNPGRPPGTRVNDRNEVVPIRAPRPETKPTKRIVPLTIDVEQVEAVQEVEELNPPPPVPVAGEDDPHLEVGLD